MIDACTMKNLKRNNLQKSKKKKKKKKTPEN